MDYAKESLRLHNEKKGKLSIKSKFPVRNKTDLSIAYTPGVAEPCRLINKNEENVYKYTIKGNMVGIVTDGSAVLGLGNIGAKASIPVMEGKAILMKRFAGVDAFPIALATQDVEEIIKAVKQISPVFGAINLEDISAPRCFEIEKRLRKELDIPIFHDDQHGTAMVVLAGLINSLKLCNKKIQDVKIVMNGAGAAGVAIAKLLIVYGFQDLIMCDTKGAIYQGRTEGMNPIKEELARITNKKIIRGSLKEAIKGADIFIGVSAPNTMTQDMIKSMNKNPVIFAMANPSPEIMPDEAKKAGAMIVATGRSDFPNQLNNVLVFPGIMKGLLKTRKQITDTQKIAVAKAIAKIIKPTKNKIIPSPFDMRVSKAVEKAIINTKE
ncbi:MAG: NADP-dependent malic enzyme [archaeon]